MKTIKLTSQQAIALATLGVMSAGMVGSVGVAQANTKGKRNLTLGLGALTVYGILKKKRTLAIAGGLGTAYAYSRYRKSHNQDKRRTQTWYRSRYGRNWRNHYRLGG